MKCWSQLRRSSLHTATAALAGGDNGGSELWSAIRRVGLAGLHLDELGYHLAPFAGGKVGDGVVLCGKFQPALALPRPGNPNVGN
jgi:hypothetical protein